MTKYRVIFAVEERDPEAVRAWALRVDRASQTRVRFVEVQRQTVWWSTVEIDADTEAP